MYMEKTSHSALDSVSPSFLAGQQVFHVVELAFLFRFELDCFSISRSSDTPRLPEGTASPTATPCLLLRLYDERRNGNLFTHIAAVQGDELRGEITPSFRFRFLVAPPRLLDGHLGDMEYLAVLPLLNSFLLYGIIKKRVRRKQAMPLGSGQDHWAGLEAAGRRNIHENVD
uniref:Uncharacterized protein n=1 Tax=Pristionchus pacificus TaxID=54126 RepID=A0A2A6B772_PRIPA|eukprot:PDM61718.1 hypothetical protein PRIPAC_51160 [Pristionchus pacificus]